MLFTVERIGVRPELQSIFVKCRQLEELLRVWNGSWPNVGSGYSILKSTADRFIECLMDSRLELTARYGRVAHEQFTNAEMTINSGWKEEVLRGQLGYPRIPTLQDATRLLQQLLPLAQTLADEVELYANHDARDQPLPRKLETVSGLCRELATIDEAIRRHSDEIEAKQLADERRRIQLKQDIETVREQIGALVDRAERLGAEQQDALADALACLQR